MPQPPTHPAPPATAPTPQKKKTFNKGYLVAGVALILLVIATVLYADVPQMWQVLRHTNFLMVLGGIVFLLGGIFLIDVRWWFLLGRKPAFRRLAHATNASFIVPILTPIPNYISRVVITGLTTEATIPQATTSMMVERMIAQIMRISTMVLAIALGVQSDLSPVSMIRSIGLSFAVLAGYLLAIRFSGQVSGAVESILTALRLPQRVRNKIVFFVTDALSVDVDMKALLASLGITVVMWSLFFMFHLLVLLAMPLGLDNYAMITIALGTLALTPPSAPAMLGLYQASQIGPNLVLRLGSFDQLLPYSMVLYFIQAIVWLALTLWGVRALDIHFKDLFRNSKDIPVEIDAQVKPSADTELG
jgi:hypothetical protein